MAGLNGDWYEALKGEFSKPYYKKLFETVNMEYRTHLIFPPAEDIFNAFHLTPLKDVKVVILGQDPYHNNGQAHGLCFSVKKGVDIPPSLVNIYQELHDDLGCAIPNHGCLTKWAEQGVLMLNTVLTVRAHQANSERSGQTDCIYPVGQPGSEEESDAQQPEASDPDGASSKSAVCFPRILWQQAVQQDKCISGESRDCPHRLADRLRKVLQFQ